MPYFSHSNAEWELAIFVVLAVVAGEYVIPAMTYARQFRETFGYRMYLLPLLSLVLFYVCVILALGDHLENGSTAVRIARASFATVVPSFLVVIFEVAYAVHKRRSVRFCCIDFDQGHRIRVNDVRSWIWRNFVRMVAIGLLILGVLVNFRGIVFNDEDAGRGGYISLHEETLHFVLFLLPASVMGLVSLLVSVSMWRYGNNASIVVHSTVCNRWIALFIGTVCLFIGYSPPLSCSCFRVTSAAGQVILLVSVVAVFTEINKETRAASRFEDFLTEENEADRIKDDILFQQASDLIEQQRATTAAGGAPSGVPPAPMSLSLMTGGQQLRSTSAAAVLGGQQQMATPADTGGLGVGDMETGGAVGATAAAGAV